MPIYALWRQATGSATASTIFLIALMLVVFFVVNAVLQTASHLIWALGRDNGLLLSNRIGSMHSTLHVPVWGLLVNAGLIFIAGCIYLASTQAFNAFINSTIILQIVSFAMPLPVTGSGMNYTCGVLGVTALLSGAKWFCHARTRYDGP
ncbi:hypothetical protein KC323_g5844 [Hortaea werneckii]|nr:hypothetical protein KC323_g5844 [Hortaea werneckii]